MGMEFRPVKYGSILLFESWRQKDIGTGRDNVLINCKFGNYCPYDPFLTV